MQSDRRDALITRIGVTINCHTPTNPITSTQLAEMYSMDEREIKSIVKNMIVSGGMKIRSWRGGYDQWLGCDMPAGYSIAKTPEQMRATCDMLHQTAMSLLERERKLLDFGQGEASLWEQADVA